MNKKITIYLSIIFLFSLTHLASENCLLAQNDTVSEITLKAISELGGRYGESNYTFSSPWTLEVDEENNLYILDANNNRIMVYAPDGKFLRQIGSIGSGKGEFYACWDFALDGKGRIYVADAGNSRVQILTQEGDYIREFPVDHQIRVIEVGPDNNLYVNSDPSKSKKLVRVLSPEGKSLSSILDIVPDEENRKNVIWALNRFRLGFDQEGNILIGRSSIARFEKYDNELKRVFQLHISGPEIDYGTSVLYQAYPKFFKERKPEGKNEAQDFIEDVIIACSDGGSRGMEYLPEIRSYHNNYYLLVVGVIHVYDQEGNLLRKYQVKDENGEPAYVHSMCFDNQGLIYGLDRYHTFKCYKFKIPE